MSTISMSTIRNAVRAATTAGTKVTVTLVDGTSVAGTARWEDPGAAAFGYESDLVLYGTNKYRGPWTLDTAVQQAGLVRADSATAVPLVWSDAGDRATAWGHSASVFPQVSKDGQGAEQTTPTTRIVPFAQIASIAATASNDPDLLPWQTNAADTTLGTRIADDGVTRVPDPAWTHGSGLE